MLEDLGRFLVQGSVTGGIGGLLVYLLTLPQRRRKISASATVEEAQAASTLSGAALNMVNDARTRAAAAEARADAAWAEVDRIRHEREEADAAHRAETAELTYRVDQLERRERDLEDVLRDNGIEPPPRRRAYDQRPTVGRSVIVTDDPSPPPEASP